MLSISGKILHAEAHRIKKRGISEIDKGTEPEQKYATDFQKRTFVLHQANGKTMSSESYMTSTLKVLSQ